MILLNPKHQLLTDQGTVNEVIQSAEHPKGFMIVATNPIRLKGGHRFEELTIGLNHSPSWITIGMKWETQTGRLFESSFSLCKEQAQLMLKNLELQISLMK